jgi:hypothetical protein
MKRPWAVLVPPPRVVETLSGPGKRAETTAAAQIEDSIWAMKMTAARKGVTAPMKRSPRVT